MYAAGDKGAWISLGVGIIFRAFYSAIQKNLDNHFDYDQNKTTRTIFIIVHNFIFAVIVISHWRGQWNLLDYYFGYLEPVNNLVCLGVSYALVLGLRCSNMILSAPFYCVL